MSDYDSNEDDDRYVGDDWDGETVEDVDDDVVGSNRARGATTHDFSGIDGNAGMGMNSVSASAAQTTRTPSQVGTHINKKHVESAHAENDTIQNGENEAPSEVVKRFIKKIQPRHIKSKQKKYITEFAKWYFHKKPVLTQEDIAYILMGKL